MSPASEEEGRDIIGIDCGGRKIALADLSRGIFFEYEAANTVPRGDQLVQIAEALQPYRNSDGSPVWVEAPIVAGARNLQSSLKIAQVTGVAHTVMDNSHEVAVASWKKAVVGNGRADKEQVRAWLVENHPDLYRLTRHSQDLIDATCIALYGEVTDDLFAAHFET